MTFVALQSRSVSETSACSEVSSPCSAAMLRGLCTAFVVPLPSWPSSLSPHVYTSPASVTKRHHSVTPRVHLTCKCHHMSPHCHPTCTPHLQVSPHYHPTCTPHLRVSPNVNTLSPHVYTSPASVTKRHHIVTNGHQCNEFSKLLNFGQFSNDTMSPVAQLDKFINTICEV